MSFYVNNLYSVVYSEIRGGGNLGFRFSKMSPFFILLLKFCVGVGGNAPLNIALILLFSGVIQDITFFLVYIASDNPITPSIIIRYIDIFTIYHLSL